MNRVATSGSGPSHLSKYNKVPYPKLRLYLSILDRLRRNRKATKEIWHPKFANANRNSGQRKLPFGEHTLVFPLGSAPVWQKLLDCKKGNIDKKRKPRAELLSKAVGGSVIYLLEFLELLYIVHKERFTFCNNTFIYYGDRLFQKSPIAKRVSWGSKTGRRGSYNALPCIEFPRSATGKNDLDEIKNLTYTRLRDDYDYTMECVMIYANKLMNSDKLFVGLTYFASTRSIFIEKTPTLLTKIWPSLVHFLQFPVDKKMYVIPVACNHDYYDVSDGHQRLIIASVNRRGVGTLRIYEPYPNGGMEGHLDLYAVRDAMQYCKLGGTKVWEVSDRPYYKGPIQGENKCLIACACIALRIAGDPEFVGFTGANEIFEENVHEGYRLKVLDIVYQVAASQNYPDPATYFYNQQQIASFSFYAS
jgi:hypothetical protein